MNRKKRHRIGQVILDKAANVKTVVNKTGIIETKFRTFPMEILAGVNSTDVELKMNGLRFKFDFAKVYWNSRLSEEHERLAEQQFKAGDLVIDAFCGVGPFALRAIKKQCAVQANDLNPESTQSLVENARLNKMKVVDFTAQVPTTVAPFEIGKIHAFNMDAREFLKFVLKGDLPASTHIVMNLPATAIEFLDALRGAFRDPPRSNLPLVHCYCFSSRPTLDERREDVVQRVKSAMKWDGELSVDVREVRDVAPNKYMLCAHFSVPKEVAYGKPEGDEEEEVTRKRQRSDVGAS